SQVNNPESNNTSPNNPQTPEAPQQSKTGQAKEMYDQAVKDINGLPMLGRIALGVFIILVLFKMTPLLDLLWFFIQIFVIPCLVLVSIGVMSRDTYMLIIGWLNDTLVWTTKHTKDIVAKKGET
ncbi:MAG: hypothetical protein VYC14_08685, partial [Actinomycetota bacterium]|nr:hypothetical protein [Actinomycetota bacterium]